MIDNLYFENFIQYNLEQDSSLMNLLIEAIIIN